MSPSIWHKFVISFFYIDSVIVFHKTDVMMVLVVLFYNISSFALLIVSRRVTFMSLGSLVLETESTLQSWLDYWRRKSEKLIWVLPSGLVLLLLLVLLTKKTAGNAAWPTSVLVAWPRHTGALQDRACSTSVSLLVGFGWRVRMHFVKAILSLLWLHSHIVL